MEALKQTRNFAQLRLATPQYKRGLKQTIWKRLLRTAFQDCKFGWKVVDESLVIEQHQNLVEDGCELQFTALIIMRVPKIYKSVLSVVWSTICSPAGRSEGWYFAGEDLLTTEVCLGISWKPSLDSWVSVCPSSFELTLSRVLHLP